MKVSACFLDYPQLKEGPLKDLTSRIGFVLI